MEVQEKRAATATHFKSLPMKKVLIAVDYDGHSQDVVEMGYSVAQAMNADVALLHVVADQLYYSTLELSPLAGFSGFTNADFMQYANNDGLIKAGHYFLDKLKHHLQDDTIDTLVKEGDYAETIIKTAHQVHANIIIMGCHHKHWLDKVLWGSVSENVLHQSKIPLLIIPIK